MKTILLLLLLAVGGNAFSESTSKEMAPVEDGQPAFQVLYENGFYQEAIDYLEQRVKDTHDPDWQIHHQYLAFSYVIVGKADSAIAVFHAILSRDPAFTLNPITTSPKIYEVFVKARDAFNPAKAEPDEGFDIPRLPRTTTDVSVADTADALPASIPFPVYRYPLLAAPGGIPQFLERRKKAGAWLLGLQVVGLAGTFVTLHLRQNLRLPNQGWTSKNIGKGDLYLNLARVQFGLFLCSYGFGITDAILHVKRSTKP